MHNPGPARPRRERRWFLRARARLRSLLVGIVAVLAGLGCDESFEPIAPSALRFSVFGYLDASADTQWIRVMPIRPLVLTSPDSFDVTVTLEHLGTGRVVELRDSVFRFSHFLHPQLGSDGAYLHNFWTTEPIEPGATYRFEARRDVGLPAKAVVRIPSDYSVEFQIRAIPEATVDFLRLIGLKHVAFITLTTHFWDRCGSAVQSLTFRPRGSPGELQTVPLGKPDVPPRERCGDPIIERRELSVIGTETQWPTAEGLSPSSLVPEEESNITNSVGFLGGGITKVVPYEECEFRGGGPVPSHCRLSYTAESARIEGIVRETRCANGAIDSAVVQLRELDGEPIQTRRIRTSVSNPDGEFRIAALEPGIRYFVHARAKRILVPGPGGGLIPEDTHTLHTDTLLFTQGERRTYDIGLHYLSPCGLAP